MKIQYFDDTDTLQITLSKGRVHDTRDVTENLLIELDEQGGIVSITVEHVTQQNIDIKTLLFNVA